MRSIRSTTLAALALAAAACSSDPNPTGSTSAAETGGASSQASGDVSGDVSSREHIAQVLEQTNLVSNLPGVAERVDPTLVNAWGFAFDPPDALSVSANGTGLCNVYDTSGVTRLAITIPSTAGSTTPAKPTGEVLNEDPAVFRGDRFIFVTEDGTVAGWPGPAATVAQLRVDESSTGAVYKGAATARVRGTSRLFATDFHNGKVDVFDENYQPVSCARCFFDPDLPAHYAPFNIVAVDGLLLVSYAEQALPEAEDDVPGEGHGFVDLFDTQGGLIQRLISRGPLSSPWGMALVPRRFGRISNDLLVGNFGDGRINVFEIEARGLQFRAAFRGVIGDANRHALAIDGLWSLAFGPDTGTSTPRHLYFTAGPNHEQAGLLGRLDVR